MTDYAHELLFGFFLTPDATQPEHLVELASLADRLGYNLLGIQDHPYQPRFLDMWTLLSVLAAKTTRLRFMPDVVNLPLRPPAVLARAAASLDILSGGRLELGLGSGAFADAAAAMGAPRHEPGEAIDALAEAIAVLRALWTPGSPVAFDGRYYQLRGARPGPTPPHPIGIWVGALKPRMLRLTGRLADGWLPSSAYAPPSQLPAMIHLVDEGAVAAGRDPSVVRRAYNIIGHFSTVESGFLTGPPRLWAAQLTDLALEHGFSTFIFAPGQDVPGDLRRFAEEVAPVVRENVAAGRRGAPRAASVEASAPEVAVPAAPARSAPVHSSSLLPETERPHRARPPDGNGVAVTPAGRRNQETLVAVHDHLRDELAQIRDAAVEVAAGRTTPAAARGLINRLTLRQNYWTLGAFCAQYCRIVSLHHTIEDQVVFPGLQSERESLADVLRRLSEEHEVIAVVVDRFDRALVKMMDEPAAIEDVQLVATELSDALLSHLAYEEDELLEPLGHSSITL